MVGKSYTKNQKLIMISIILILAAITLRGVGRNLEGKPHLILAHIRTYIYIGLYCGWMISVNRRIIQKQTRHLLLAIGSLAILWIMLRTAKYFYVQDPSLKRFLWYLYYFPMCMMPTLWVAVALSVGKPENWRLPNWVQLFLVIPIALAFGVLLNDYHQLAFRFLTPDFSEDHYVYGQLYWAASIWAMVCGFAGLGILIRKCRLPHSRHFMLAPFFPASVSIVYCVGYYFHNPVMMAIAGDITAFLCLFFIATMECCIQCGLIRTNSYYDELFRISSLRALITDKKYQVALTSEGGTIPTREQMVSTEDGPVMLEDGVRLSAAPIRDGHVLWMEDVSELMEVLAELEEVGNYLEGERKVLEEEYETTREQQKMVEKNRLYNKIMTKTNDQIEYYGELVERLNQTEDPEEIAYLVSRIAVVCTYIKRRDNMIFLDETNEEDAGREMHYCLEETIGALRLCDVNCECFVNIDRPVGIGKIAYLYETLYQVIVESLDYLTHFYVYVNEEQKDLVMMARMVCEGAFAGFHLSDAEIVQEGNSWTITITTNCVVRGGGNL